MYSLNEIRTPGATKIEYDYDHVRFADNTMFFNSTTAEITVIKTKTVSGGNVASGTWNYAYAPGNSTTDDLTTITHPNGERTQYRHFGMKQANNGTVWKIGTLTSKSLQTSSGSVIRNEAYTWGNEQLSTQDVKSRRETGDKDTNVYAPLLTNKVITQDGTNYSSTFSNFEYGQPTRIVESGNASRTLDLEYQHFTTVTSGKWKLHMLTESDLSTVSGSVTYGYDSDGNLTSMNQYGATDTYSRCSNGEVNIHTNPNGNRTQYLCTNYKNGVPRTEVIGHNSSDAVTITRSVNNDGTIASETRDGKTTSYVWDDLNRLTSITTPSPTDANISIAWNAAGTQQTLTRGSFTSVQKFDGLGRLTSKTVEGIETQYAYDVQGRKIEESNIGAITTNTDFEYDVLDRLVEVNPPGNGNITYQYLSNNRESIQDERNYTTQMTYRAYGEPLEKSVTRIASPHSITTDIGRDGLDNITSVSQGGLTRTYSYNTRKQLISIAHPEIGLETFDRDPLGNMTSHQIASNAATSYTYDALERLKTINSAASGTPDISFTYDLSGNMASASRNNGHNWSYQYSPNNILTQETLTLSSPAKTFQFTYALDNLDNISGITYPSGVLYTMNSNDLGRITNISVSGGPSVISNAVYWPNGAVNSVSYANGMVSGFTQDNRYRTIQATTNNNVFNTTYGYDSSGNMNSLIDYVDGSHSLNSLNYDGLNRLTTINNVTVLSYDARSNIITNQLAGLNLTYNYDSANRLSNISNSSYSFSYDSRGNITNNGSNQFTFNEANELTAVAGQSGPMQYDAHHYRTLQTKAQGNIYTVYTRSGKIMYEVNEISGSEMDYLYVGSQLVSRNEKCLPQDSDSDGIPDCFENQMGLNSQDPSDASQDIDGDGLTNLEEYQYGTNLLSIDTDNDGIQDKYEVDNGLNPNLNDSSDDLDSDGLTNLEEYQLGTDPNNADTDGDGVLDGSDESPVINVERLIPIMIMFD